MVKRACLLRPTRAALETHCQNNPKQLQHYHRYHIINSMITGMYLFSHQINISLILLDQWYHIVIEIRVFTVAQVG